ncbi:hypothetical protein LZC95_07840 [Pendulispora brunnea]|uniref:Uncharacterized protein n=1 Tax=Pendulispora brunnea TaxID=2905690 RepID=A0ABZ2KDR6_9BACT
MAIKIIELDALANIVAGLSHRDSREEAALTLHDASFANIGALIATSPYRKTDRTACEPYAILAAAEAEGTTCNYGEAFTTLAELGPNAILHEETRAKLETMRELLALEYAAAVAEKYQREDLAAAVSQAVTQA